MIPRREAWVLLGLPTAVVLASLLPLLFRTAGVGPLPSPRPASAASKSVEQTMPPTIGGQPRVSWARTASVSMTSVANASERPLRFVFTRPSHEEPTLVPTGQTFARSVERPNRPGSTKQARVAPPAQAESSIAGRDVAERSGPPARQVRRSRVPVASATRTAVVRDSERQALPTWAARAIRQPATPACDLANAVPSTSKPKIGAARTVRASRFQGGPDLTIERAPTARRARHVDQRLDFRPSAAASARAPRLTFRSAGWETPLGISARAELRPAAKSREPHADFAALFAGDLPIEPSAQETQGTPEEQPQVHADKPNQMDRVPHEFSVGRASVGRLEGRVDFVPADRRVRACGGIAMPGVRVVLDTGQAAWTDQHGWFCLTDVPFGTVRLSVDPQTLAGSEPCDLPAPRVVRISEDAPYVFLTMRCRAAI